MYLLTVGLKSLTTKSSHSFNALLSDTDYDLTIKGFNSAFYRHQHWLTTAVQGLGRCDFHPAFTDAIFLDIEAFFAIQPNTNVMLENFCHMMWARGVTRKAIWQSGF